MVAKKTSHTKQLTGIIKEIEKLQYNTKCILNGCYHFWVLTEVFQQASRHQLETDVKALTARIQNICPFKINGHSFMLLNKISSLLIGQKVPLNSV
ncbi:hypothetical protein P5673_004700, partial [Acropora cervicornis]